MSDFSEEVLSLMANSLDAIFTQNNMDNDANQTEMTDMNDDNDSMLQTPEPNSPNAAKDERTEVVYNDNTKENISTDNLSPKSASNHLDDEEEKDSLYDVLAPKQSIKGQMNEVVDSIPDQNNIVVASDDDDNEEEVQPIAYNPKRSMDFGNSDHYNLKSTLKKDQRAWVDPWEAAVQDTFYHKEIKDLRPTFEVVTSTIKGVESLRNLFQQSPATINEDNEYDENPDDHELEMEEKAMAEEPKGMYFFLTSHKMCKDN